MWKARYIVSCSDHEEGRGWMNHLFIYIITTFFHILISAATGDAAPGCSGTVNAAD